MRKADCSNAEPTLLFDYRNHYLPALGAYLEGLGSKPNPYCYLVFGQDVSMFNLNSSVLIVVAVASQAALCDLEKAEMQHVRTIRPVSRTLMNISYRHRSLLVDASLRLIHYLCFAFVGLYLI